MRRAALVFAAAFGYAGSCGGTCPPGVAPPVAMTEARAHEIDASVTTGLAASAAHVHGDCRPVGTPEEAAGACGPAMACVRERADLRVLIVPVNRSVPMSPSCEGGYDVPSVAPLASVDTRASRGELVVPLPPGMYTLYVSHDDTCASCALADGACLIEIARERLTVRDLVLDRATH